MKTIRPILLAAALLLCDRVANAEEPPGGQVPGGGIDRLLDVPYHTTGLPEPVPAAGLQLLRQDYELPQKAASRIARYPFSFLYGGKRSDDVLPQWTRETKTAGPAAGRSERVTTWTDPRSGLRRPGGDRDCGRAHS